MMEAVDITNLSFNILADDGMSNEDLYCGMWYLAYITLILKLLTARIAKKYRFLICIFSLVTHNTINVRLLTWNKKFRKKLQLTSFLSIQQNSYKNAF